MGQQNVINVTTAFFTDPTTGRTELTRRGTIPPTCAEARLKGGKPLEPEESLTFTVDMVTERGPFSFTADYYRIDVEGRLAQSATRNPTDAEKDAIGASGCVPAADINNFRYFTNSLDTRTQGVDLVASVDLSPVAAGLDENPFARDFGSKYPESAPMGIAGASTTPAPATASTAPTRRRPVSSAGRRPPRSPTPNCAGFRPAFSSGAPVAPPPGKRGAVA